MTKTAYEMRISDWSSDVCSSDLVVDLNGLEEPFILRRGQRLLLPSEPGRDHAQTLEERAAAFRIDVDDIMTGTQPALKEGEGTAPASAAPQPLPSTAATSTPTMFSTSAETRVGTRGARRRSARG